jgi:hypothetical protein
MTFFTNKPYEIFSILPGNSGEMLKKCVEAVSRIQIIDKSLGHNPRVTKDERPS